MRLCLPTQCCCCSSFVSISTPVPHPEETMLSHRRFLPASIVPALLTLLAVALLAACGSVNHNNPGPTPTPTPPGATPTPTPPGPTPSPTPTPSAGNAITGRVVDPNGVPVVGTVVVDLELGGGDFFTFRQTKAE